MAESKKQELSFTTIGVQLAGLTLIGNEVLKIANMGLTTAGGFSFLPVAGVAGASLIGGILLDRLYKESDYEKLFRMCGIVNKDGKVPLVMKKEPCKDGTVDVLLYMPAGISQKDFEEKKEKIEQYMNSRVEFTFNKNLVMKLVEMNLSKKYKYIFEECDEPLKLFIGYSDYGKYYLDIKSARNILVAGEPGTGKSTLLRVLATSALLSKFDVEVNLHDFQNVELLIFSRCKKVKSYGSSIEEFENLLDRMEEEQNRRLKLFSEAGDNYFINSISRWNKQFPKKQLSYILNLVDECQTLDPKKDEEILLKIGERARKDRKVGIHWVFGYHRPSADSLPGRIKGNIPVRIAFHTVTKVDSEVILDQPGAEKLSTQGRCIIKNNDEIKEVQILLLEEDDCMDILKANKKFKSREELESEKQHQEKAAKEDCERLRQEKLAAAKEQEENKKKERQRIIDDFHKNNKNPYKKGEINDRKK